MRRRPRWTSWSNAAPGWTCTATRWWPPYGSRRTHRGPETPQPVHADLRHDHRRDHEAGGPAGRAPGDAGEHGVHRGLPETGLLPARGPTRGVADQRRAPAQRARPQDRCRRLGMDRADGRTRPGPAQLRAPATDPRTARPEPPPAHPGRGTHPRGAAAGEGHAGRRDQADQRGIGSAGQVRAGDAGGAVGRADRPGRARRAGPGVGCAARSPRCGRPWPAGSASSTTGCWPHRCWPTSTSSTLPFPRRCHFLDAAIAELDASLDKAAAPFQAPVKRVCTIPESRSGRRSCCSPSAART
jgi:hypothetical protein